MSAPNEEDLDIIGIKQVVDDGHRLRLRKRERTEAVRIMCEREVPSFIQMWLLKIDYRTLGRAAHDANSSLPGTVDAHWTYQYWLDERERARQSGEDTKRKFKLFY